MSAVLKPDDTQPMDLVALCKQILSPVQIGPRLKKQLEVEQAILDFNPDLNEAREILDAISAALNRRYTSDRLIVVEEEFRTLKIAMEESEPYEPSEEDRKYDDHVYNKMDEARGL